VSITNHNIIKKNYDIIAESEKNPVIIEHFNTVAVQFYVTNTYPESVMILRNFIKHKMSEIQSNGRIDITLESANMQQKLM
jgi:hypothetical protein